MAVVVYRRWLRRWLINLTVLLEIMALWVTNLHGWHASTTGALLSGIWSSFIINCSVLTMGKFYW